MKELDNRPLIVDPEIVERVLSAPAPTPTKEQEEARDAARKYFDENGY